MTPHPSRWSFASDAVRAELGEFPETLLEAGEEVWSRRESLWSNIWPAVNRPAADASSPGLCRIPSRWRSIIGERLCEAARTPNPFSLFLLPF